MTVLIRFKSFKTFILFKEATLGVNQLLTPSKDTSAAVPDEVGWNLRNNKVELGNQLHTGLWLVLVVQRLLASTIQRLHNNDNRQSRKYLKSYLANEKFAIRVRFSFPSVAQSFLGQSSQSWTVIES